MKATAVIGAGFGDEGKGHIVDYLSDSDTCVIRYNGGAQAGHTVQDDERRHPFHHFGSGTFRGASTYLSQHFLVNPMLWDKETEEIDAPFLEIHQKAPLTTYFDMLINQFVEEARGASRHGSCGVGINETIVRNQHLAWATYVDDVRDSYGFAKKLRQIQRTYAIPRFKCLTGKEPPEMFRHLVESEELFTHFISTTFNMMMNSHLFSNLPEADKYIFEGAQGLLLDEDHKFFPHVTHSRPGLANILEVCTEAGVTELDVYYVLRSYMTRHGAGPFPTEDPTMSFRDDTNIVNQFQGGLRFGVLDYDLIREAIDKDLSQVPSSVKVRAGLAVNCLDQYPAALESMRYKLGLSVSLASYGPARRDIIKRENKWS